MGDPLLDPGFAGASGASVTLKQVLRPDTPYAVTSTVETVSAAGFAWCTNGAAARVEIARTTDRFRRGSLVTSETTELFAAAAPTRYSPGSVRPCGSWTMRRACVLHWRTVDSR